MACRKTDILQWILCQRVVSEREALVRYRDLSAPSLPADDDDALDEEKGRLLAEIRDILLPYQLDVKRVRGDDGGDTVIWVIQNTAEDRIAELATLYSVEEINCFKSLVSNTGTGGALLIIASCSCGSFPTLPSIKAPPWTPW